MPPRLLQLMMGALLAVSALVACRKEVPLPPVPDEVPTPKAGPAQHVALSGATLRHGC